MWIEIWIFSPINICLSIYGAIAAVAHVWGHIACIIIILKFDMKTKKQQQQRFDHFRFRNLLNHLTAELKVCSFLVCFFFFHLRKSFVIKFVKFHCFALRITISVENTIKIVNKMPTNNRPKNVIHTKKGNKYEKSRTGWILYVCVCSMRMCIWSVKV